MSYIDQIKEIYARRQKAHDELLACDVEIDNLLKIFINELQEQE